MCRPPACAHSPGKRPRCRWMLWNEPEGTWRRKQKAGGRIPQGRQLPWLSHPLLGQRPKGRWAGWAHRADLCHLQRAQATIHSHTERGLGHTHTHIATNPHFQDSQGAHRCWGSSQTGTVDSVSEVSPAGALTQTLPFCILNEEGNVPLGRARPRPRLLCATSLASSNHRDSMSDMRCIRDTLGLCSPAMTWARVLQ